jgi:hypothetical protein
MEREGPELVIKIGMFCPIHPVKGKDESEAINCPIRQIGETFQIPVLQEEPCVVDRAVYDVRPISIRHSGL